MRTLQLDGRDGPVRLIDAAPALARVAAASWRDGLYGLGYAHGRDRGGQLALMRYLGQGRLAECVRDTPQTRALDRHYRSLGLARDARAHAGALAPDCVEPVQAYCRGVSDAWAAGRPWVLRLFGIRPRPWWPEDVLLLAKLSAYAGLAESQRILELFLVAAVRRGLSAEELHALFPQAGAPDLALMQGLIDLPSWFPSAAPALGTGIAGGSNAWVVAGSRTASGHAMLCNDPHLEVNRLPAVMYQAWIDTPQGWVKGATLPGLPAFIVGRTARIAWGVTYSFADTCDFFVERCRDGRHLRAGQWRPLQGRRERVLGRRGAPLEFNLYETDAGILEGDPWRDGDHLCWDWVGRGAGGIAAIESYLALPHCDSVAAAQRVARRIDIPTLHMVLADNEGHIGYQFTGAVPRRPGGGAGLLPRPAWLAEQRWQGCLDPDGGELPALIDPPEGCIVTANEARQVKDGPVLTAAALGDFRKTRIETVLAATDRVGLQDMRALQYDVYSVEAERMRPVYLPHVANVECRRLLADWDCRYTVDSRAATLFENIQREVFIAIFGARLGCDWLRAVLSETHLYALLAARFGAILLQQDSVWLPQARRDALLAPAVAAGAALPAGPWGERNRIRFDHLLLGRLPAWLGAPVGATGLPGNHATVRQGAVVQLGKRISTSAACYRMITDLGSAALWSNLPGGRSEWPLAADYAAAIENWLQGRYQAL